MRWIAALSNRPGPPGAAAPSPGSCGSSDPSGHFVYKNICTYECNFGLRVKADWTAREDDRGDTGLPLEHWAILPRNRLCRRHQLIKYCIDNFVYMNRMGRCSAYHRPTSFPDSPTGSASSDIARSLPDLGRPGSMPSSRRCSTRHPRVSGAGGGADRVDQRSAPTAGCAASQFVGHFLLHAFESPEAIVSVSGRGGDGEDARGHGADPGGCTILTVPIPRPAADGPAAPHPRR